MKNITLSLFALFLTFSSQTASASLSCEQWQSKLPPKYKTDFRTASDPEPSASSVTLSCGKVIGNAAVSYVKASGTHAVILQLTARLGISGATTSMVMVTGYKVLAAYTAVKMIYSAFEKDAACFVDHDFKRGMIEPVAHFYSPAMIDGWVKNLGCTHLSQMVYTKVKSVEQDIHSRKIKQRDYDNYVKGRVGMEERAERLYPAALRTLSPEQLVFLDKRERMEKPVALFDAATGLLPCLKPEALSRMACGLVVELGWKYQNLTSPQGLGLDDVLVESILRVGAEKR